MTQTIRSTLPGVMAAVIFALVYSVVQLNDENTELRHREARQAARLCLSDLGDKVFTHSGFTKLRAGRVRVSCYYTDGRKE